MRLSSSMRSISRWDANNAEPFGTHGDLLAVRVGRVCRTIARRPARAGHDRRQNVRGHDRSRAAARLADVSVSHLGLPVTAYRSLFLSLWTPVIAYMAMLFGLSSLSTLPSP